MPKSRHRRDEPPPRSGDQVVRGVLGPSGVTSGDLRAAAVLNHDLYDFYGVSVWIPNIEHPLARLEQTKLYKFSQYAAFSVAHLVARGLELWATGQAPHYDVVHHDLDTLVEQLRSTPHQIRINPQVDREER
jgi:hypothetical protein